MPSDVHESETTEAGLRRRTFLAGTGGAAALALASPQDAVAAPVATGGDSYVIQWRRARQTILGLGYEIQSDSIGSGNNGLPEAFTSVPHDLVQPERMRFYDEMLKAGGDRGFRYCRLAMGLYLRGLTPDKKQIVGRWPEQMGELREMIEKSKTEGLMVEYWSPAPAWKTTNSYLRGTIKSDQQEYVSEFSDALVADVKYLEDNGLPVSWWGLQNEPNIVGDGYSGCSYSPDMYYKVFRSAASRMRSTFPKVLIHANSLDGQHGVGCDRIRADESALALVDSWTHHHIGWNSNSELQNDYTIDSEHRKVYNNEFEYLSWNVSRTPWYTVNTAQSIINWMVFQDSQTWVWLHALKPTYNAEALGYSLGFWRPWDDDNFADDHFPDLPKGHWTWNTMNWHGLAGFLRHMPWDSVRVEVDEPSLRGDQRIMAWISPGGKKSFVITNRAATPFTYTVDAGPSAGFAGSRYSHEIDAQALGVKTGDRLTFDVPAYSIEFWTEGEDA